MSIQPPLRDEPDQLPSALDLLAPDHTPSARQALARFHQQVNTPIFYRRSFMNTNKWRFATLVAVVMILLVGMVTFPQTRALASQFLGLFRVQKFTAIGISAEQLANLEKIGELGLHPGEMTILEEPSEPQQFTDINAAIPVWNEMSGQPFYSAYDLGNPQEVSVVGGSKGYLTIDLTSARAILQAGGVDPSLLPDSLEGAQVNVQTYPVLHQSWEGVTLLQTRSPELGYPTDVNPAVIGEAMLRLMGVNEIEAAGLAQQIDWSATMVLPIPTQFSSFREVRVAGAVGLAVESADSRGNMILWQQDGTLFAVIGDMETTELLNIADQLR